MATKKQSKSVEEQTTFGLELPDLAVQRIVVHVVGTAPLLPHRLSTKAEEELIFPAPAITKSQRRQQKILKHDPIAEFRNCLYLRDEGPDAPLIWMPASAVKKALVEAVRFVPGVHMTEIKALLHVEGSWVPVWGTPYLYINIVRMSGINPAPDTRVRPLLPRWAMRFVVRATKPYMNETAVAKLVRLAGEVQGIGDGRPGKSGLSYGTFRVADVDEPELLDIMQEGHDAQLRALQDVYYFDDESRYLVEYTITQAKQYGFDVTLPGPFGFKLGVTTAPATVGAQNGRADVALAAGD